MSWGVNLEIDAGGPEPVYLSLLEANATWNLGPMYRAANPEHGFGNHWDGTPAQEAADRCKVILAAFGEDPAKYRALNPPNGWGDFEVAQAFIQQIHDACMAAPRATLRVG